MFLCCCSSAMDPTCRRRWIGRRWNSAERGVTTIEPLPDDACAVVVPTREGETYGLIGWEVEPNLHRLAVFADKESGRMLLASAGIETGELPQLIDRAFMPERTAEPIYKFGPFTSWWFLWWYHTYRRETGLNI